MEAITSSFEMIQDIGELLKASAGKFISIALIESIKNILTK